MESSETPNPRQFPFPSRALLLKPSTWRNRGRLVGLGSPAPRRHAGQSPALLAIHGFGGTPAEVEILLEVARKRGLAASAPLLPGHGSHARDLASRTFEDWLGAARTELRRLQEQGDVILVGSSLGSVIVSRLAIEAGARIRGLALFANALRLASPYPSRWLAVARRLHLPHDWWIPKLAADIADGRQREAHLGYDAEPIRAAIEVYRGGLQTRRLLGHITCPTLLVHGALDRVCPVSNVNLVMQALGTRDATSVILKRSGHVVTEDCERQGAAAALDAFIVRLLVNPIEGPPRDKNGLSANGQS